MGWSEVAARSHARRLEAEGWLERCAMVRGQGSMFLTTRKGVQVLGAALIAAATPAPTSWQHDSGCAWTAAWLTLRGREFLGQRELVSSTEWSGQLTWQERENRKRRGHRPDLVGFVDGSPVAVEVELAGKSRARLDAILRLHLDWMRSDKTGAVLYVCGDEEGRRRVEPSAGRLGITGGRLRVQQLDTIKQETAAAFAAQRSEAVRAGSAAPPPMLSAHGS